MIADTLATLQVKDGTTKDGEGMIVDVWTASNTAIICNIQPNNSSHVLKLEHGLSTESYEYIIFVKKKVVTLNRKSVYRIVVSSDTYTVERIKDYPNHYELLCNLS